MPQKPGLKKDKQVAKPAKTRKNLFAGVKSFRLRRKAERPKVPKLTGTWKLLKATFAFMAANWKLLAVLGVVYLVAFHFFVQGLLAFDMAGQDAADQEMFGIGSDIAGATAPTTQSSAFGGLLSLLFALAIVWTARQRSKGVKIRARDALYSSAAPIVPVMAILGVIFAQLLPMALGIFLYAIATFGGIAANGVENMAIFVVALLASTLSCYWLSSSAIALMIVTVPGMYPWAALRAAKELVSYRRWHIFLRMLTLTLAIAIVWGIAVLFAALVTKSHQLLGALAITTVASILQVLTVMIVAIFMYKLYRTLVDETAE